MLAAAAPFPFAGNHFPQRRAFGASIPHSESRIPN
jgi:hypothetical protein